MVVRKWIKLNIGEKFIPSSCVSALFFLGVKTVQNGSSQYEKKTASILNELNRQFSIRYVSYLTLRRQSSRLAPSTLCTGNVSDWLSCWLCSRLRSG